MEHRFFRIGSLLVCAALIGHVALELRKAEADQNGVQVIMEIIVIAVIGGILFVTWILPTLGDKMTEAMISSGEQMEKTAGSEMAALIAAGDYEGAIAALQKQSLAEPANRQPVMEIARLYRDKLDDLDSALQTLQTALVSREWSPESEATLRLRRAELLARDLKDFTAAKAEVQAVLEKYPGTPQAGSATVRLREIEEQQYLATRQG